MEGAAVVSLLVSRVFSGVGAVDYVVTNNASGTLGGARFDLDVGLNYSNHVLVAASFFFWSIFQQPADADRKRLRRIALTVEPMQDGVVTYTSADEIPLSVDYIASYSSGDLRMEVLACVLYHEVTNLWQWNRRGSANCGLIEGIANYVRLKAGYAEENWVEPGEESGGIRVTT